MFSMIHAWPPLFTTKKGRRAIESAIRLIIDVLVYLRERTSILRNIFHSWNFTMIISNVLLFKHRSFEDFRNAPMSYVENTWSSLDLPLGLRFTCVTHERSLVVNIQLVDDRFVQKNMRSVKNIPSDWSLISPSRRLPGQVQIMEWRVRAMLHLFCTAPVN